LPLYSLLSTSNDTSTVSPWRKLSILILSPQTAIHTFLGYVPGISRTNSCFFHGLFERLKTERSFHLLPFATDFYSCKVTYYHWKMRLVYTHLVHIFDHGFKGFFYQIQEQESGDRNFRGKIYFTCTNSRHVM
jgi:hypothetical protein